MWEIDRESEYNGRVDKHNNREKERVSVYRDAGLCVCGGLLASPVRHEVFVDGIIVLKNENLQHEMNCDYCSSQWNNRCS